MSQTIKKVVAKLEMIDKEFDKQRWALENIAENSTCEREIKLKSVQLLRGFGYDQVKERASLLKNDGHCNCPKCLAKWALEVD
jgi:hypothetical protein